MFALLIVLAMLASFRVGRLITADKATEKVRDRAAGITRNDQGDVIDTRRPVIAYLLTCPWCVSMYYAGPAAALVVFAPDNRAVWTVMLALALSASVGLLATIEDMLDRVWPEPEAE